jgi:hypothetical protein
MTEYAVCWSTPGMGGVERSQWSGPESEPRPASDVTLEGGLNAMAEQGWELVFLAQPGPTHTYTLVFKRDRRQ